MAQQQVRQMNNKTPSICDYTIDDNNGYTYIPPQSNPVNSTAEFQKEHLSKQTAFEDYVNNMLYTANKAQVKYAQQYPVSRTTVPEREPFMTKERYPYELSDKWGTSMNNRFNPIVDSWNDNRMANPGQSPEEAMYNRESAALDAVMNGRGRKGEVDLSRYSNSLYTNPPINEPNDEHFTTLHSHADMNRISDCETFKPRIEERFKYGTGIKERYEPSKKVFPTNGCKRLSSNEIMSIVICVIVFGCFMLLVVSMIMNQRQQALIAAANMEGFQAAINGGRRSRMSRRKQPSWYNYEDEDGEANLY